MSNNTHTSTEEIKGPPHVHHMDAPTAYQSAKLGMWLFLATEILLFGGLFTAFAIYRYLYLDEFHSASKLLDWRMGAINTVVLIFSSFTAALAVDAAQHGDNKRVQKNILITMLCGIGFLVIKYFEYKGKAHHNLFPAGESGFALFILLAGLLIGVSYFIIALLNKFKIAISLIISLIIIFGAIFLNDFLAGIHFDLAKIIPFGSKSVAYPDVVFNSPEFSQSFKSYFGLYYCMTGLHALHVVIGMGLLFWVYIKSLRNRFSPNYYTPVEVGALYWHLVDLIWIYLFPLLYLVG